MYRVKGEIRKKDMEEEREGRLGKGEPQLRVIAIVTESKKKIKFLRVRMEASDVRSFSYNCDLMLRTAVTLSVYLWLSQTSALSVFKPIEHQRRRAYPLFFLWLVLL